MQVLPGRGREEAVWLVSCLPYLCRLQADVSAANGLQPEEWQSQIDMAVLHGDIVKVVSLSSDAF